MLNNRFDYMFNLIRDKDEANRRQNFLSSIRQMIKESNIAHIHRKDRINNVKDASLETLKPFRM